MVRDDKQGLLLDPCNNKISFPDGGLAGTVPMFDVLLIEARSCYSGDEVLRTQQSKSQQAHLSAQWCKRSICQSEVQINYTKIVELVSEQPKEINGLFSVLKEGDKQRLILEATCASQHITEPDCPELPHPWYLQQMTLNKQREIWVGKLDSDNFYHRLSLPTNFQQQFGLPAVHREGKKVWSQLNSVPTVRYHPVAISHLTHGEILYTEARQDVKDALRGGSSKTRMECRFGIYTDDCFVFGKSKKRVLEVYDRFYSL